MHRSRAFGVGANDGRVPRRAVVVSGKRKPLAVAVQQRIPHAGRKVVGGEVSQPREAAAYGVGGEASGAVCVAAVDSYGEVAAEGIVDGRKRRATGCRRKQSGDYAGQGRGSRKVGNDGAVDHHLGAQILCVGRRGKEHCAGHGNIS